MNPDAPSHDYNRRQAVRDAQYAADYQSWVASLPESERARLKAAGIDRPDTSYTGTGRSDHDMAESPLAREESRLVEQLEPVAPVPPTNAVAPEDINEQVWDVLRRLIGELLDQKNSALFIECLAVVSGVGFMGNSMTEIAKRHGLTRAAVSKRCVELSERLGLLPSRSMRSLTARSSYAQTQHSIARNYESRNRQGR